MSSIYATASFRPLTRVHIERWPTELPYAASAIVVSAALWLLAFSSATGALYAGALILFMAASKLVFVAHVRGSAVRVTPRQLPALYQRVFELSSRLGLDGMPEVYVMQAHGALNAAATRFVGRSIVILYADLLEACGDNTDARDFIIGHELGHIRAGHLHWRWFLTPGLLVPFVGGAYTRACEYTADKLGFAVVDRPDAAVLGLSILAAGGRLGAGIDRKAFAAQSRDLDTPTMLLGQWLSAHPSLVQRLVALQPALSQDGRKQNRTKLKLRTAAFGSGRLDETAS